MNVLQAIRRQIGLLVLVTCTGGCVAITADVGPSYNRVVELRPGVVIDTAAEVMFIMAPDNSVEALNTRQGEVLWTSSEASKPLWAAEGVLLCQAESSEVGTLELVILNAENLGDVVGKYNVELPGDVYGTVGAVPNRFFKVWATEVNDDVIVSWHQQKHPNIGQFDPNAEMTWQSGSFIFDMETGDSYPLDPKTKSADVKPLSRDLAETERMKGYDGIQFRSADNSHVLLSERIADNRTWDKYEWTLVHRKSGGRIGNFRNFQSQAAFLIIEPLLIFESAPYRLRVNDEMVSEPLEIRAINLATGDEQWSRRIRNTDYRGDLPP